MALSDGVVFSRVVGLGTMNNSVQFKQFLESSQERGFRKFVFDLADCNGFDSTFMGILLGVALGEGSVVLVNATDTHRKLLSEVGIHRIVRVCEEPVAFPAVEMAELDVRPLDPKTRFRHILGAHEQLLRVDRRNQEKFGAFLELLRRELGEGSV